ncbi:MAG: hypothetical protein C4520_21625 [Candidatus Abyssobacteria bacterium SURF_5]|uniref:Uncharacterized protein n=1 Tax=Abyssobacteria bacterium (strain SURF_5) TaxID=2093360 RepID=A0A3A4MW62_ABYX5|nr:MAG: hypothetical protein C4520_21625 [Candidatus Abyssubacteria bacterium SURF_5]
MNFFRSEEHLRNWKQFDPATEAGIIPVADLVKLFSIDFFRKRMEPDYISRMQEFMPEFFNTLREIGKTGPFWVP